MAEPIRISVVSAIHQHYTGNGRHYTLRVWSAVVSCGSDILATTSGDSREDAIAKARATMRELRDTFPSVYAGKVRPSHG